MTYQFQSVSFQTPVTQITNSTDLGLPATYPCFLFSGWFTPIDLRPSASVSWIGGGININWTVAQFGYSITSPTGLIGQGLIPVSLNPGVMVNFLMSIDGPTHQVQLYINDQEITGGIRQWFSTQQIKKGTVAWTLQANSCTGDVWWNNQGTFTDLSVTSNRRKFINADLTPVDLGASGSTPFGASPKVFLHCAAGSVTPSDFAANSGTGGGFTPTGLVFGSCALVPPTPPTPSTVVAVPIPETLGRWRGQTGINWKGMALVGDGFSPVIGLSDFENFTEYGNTMRLLVTTPPLHDDRKRIFIPRFEIEVEAGEGQPDDPTEAPIMRLEWSKDGGKTWATLRPPQSMGLIGQYIRRLRWLNLGQSRTWVFRLTCTDPVRRYIIGTYADEYKSLG